MSLRYMPQRERGQFNIRLWETVNGEKQNCPRYLLGSDCLMNELHIH